MKQAELPHLLLDQSKHLFWMINPDFQLIYANKRYLSFIKEVTGVEKKLNESVFVEGFGEGIIEKWKAYYNRALKGEHFEIEEHFYHPGSNKIQYTQATFEPLTGEDDKIFAVACQSKDITRIVKERSEAIQLMDASLDVFCTINEQGNFVYVSAAALIHWGYSPEELIGKPFQDLILEEDVPTSIEIEAAILSGREIKSFNNRYKKQDGGIAYNLWSARWDDNTKLMYAVARDYSDKIEQEEKIQQSEQRFKALVQEGSDLIGILDAEYNYIYVSPTSTSFLGMAPEEFIGRNRFEFIHTDDVERTLASLQKIASEKRVIIEPVRFQNHKKEWRWVETVLTNMLDNPAVKGIVANSRDITDKIEEKHKLKLLESVITNTKDAVLITEAEPFDHPGPRILYVNEAFTKMTGYSEAEVIGKTPRILQGPNSDKKELSRLSRAIRNWESCEITTINYKKNGEEFWINFALTPVADEKGWYTHWISIERDVTEQKMKELENELLAQINVNFNAGNDYTSAANEVCKSISKFGKFDWVEVWTANLEKSEMQLFSHYVAAPEDEKFYDYSPDVKALKISDGLAGKVWSERAQLLWNDIDKHDDFIRRDAAKQIGLKSVLGIPLISNDEVVGVLKIGTKNSGNYLKKYTQIFKNLEGFIGSELNRKKLENDLSHLFNTIPDILCLADFKGRFLKINKAACELLGYREEEILFHTFDEFVHPEDKDIFTNKLQRLGHGENILKFENRYLINGGDIIWLSWYCNSVVEEGVIYATAKNITEEKKLRELNRQVGRLAKIGSWEVDLAKQSIFWSDEIHQLHETDPKSFVPNLEASINFYKEDFRQLVQLNVEKCISTGEPFDFEAVLVTAKKKEVWVRAIGNTEFVDGVCKRIYGSFQDINDRKESENRLLSLSENLPGVVYQYLIHPDGTDSLQHVSGGAEELWGFTANEVMENLSMIWNQIKAGGDFEEVQASILKSIQTKIKWTSRFKYVMPSGELRTHLGSGTPIFLADGTILYNSIVLDITQEVKNEELLTQACEMAQIGSWEVDLVNQKIFWSEKLHQLHETDPKSFVPNLEGSINFYRQDFRQIVQLNVEKSISTGEPFDFEAVLVTAKKNEVWVRAIGNTEFADGECKRIYGSFQDINSLKESENRLLSLSENLPGIVYQYLIHPDGTDSLRYVSGAVEKVWGFTANEVLENVNLVWDQIKAGGEFEAVKASVLKSVQTKSRWTCRLKYVLPSGELRTQLGIGTPIFLTDGTILFNSITLDITQEAKNEELLSQASQMSRIGSWELDLVNQDGDNMYWSPMVKEILEVDDSYNPTLTGGIEFYIGENKEKVQQEVNNLITEDLEFDEEILILSAKGKKRWIRVIGKSETVNKKRTKIYGSLQDIDERKKSEENILKSNERFEKVTEATEDAIWDWDIVNQTYYRSKAIERFFGKEDAGLFTESHMWSRDYFHPDDCANIKSSFYEAIANALISRWELEYRVINESGDTLYVIDRAVIYRNNEGKAFRMVGAMTDISEQKQMTIQLSELNHDLQKNAIELKRSNEELEQFAFVASHDLQEPLRMISSFMDLLKRKYGNLLDEKGHQYIHFATDGAKRMKQNILDLLQYSRTSKPTNGKEEVDLNELFSEYKLLRKKLISEKNATITSKNLPTLNTFKAALTQIFHCLLDNALKYSLEGTPTIVDIDVAENETEWKFFIKDNGIGIDPEFYDKIFIIFQRLHNKDEYSGTGIGLSIAKRHVQFLGGRIWLDSVPGEGTIFYFTIPKN